MPMVRRSFPPMLLCWLPNTCSTRALSAHRVAAHQLVPSVNADVVFVAEVRTPMLLGPACVLVLLAVLRGLLLPLLRGLARLHRRIVIAGVALTRRGHDRRIDNLTAHRQIALGLEVTVEQVEQADLA